MDDLSQGADDWITPAESTSTSPAPADTSASGGGDDWITPAAEAPEPGPGFSPDGLFTGYVPPDGGAVGRILSAAGQAAKEAYGSDGIFDANGHLQVPQGVGGLPGLREAGALYSGLRGGVLQLGEELGIPEAGRALVTIPDAFAGSPFHFAMPGEPAPAPVPRARIEPTIGPRATPPAPETPPAPPTQGLSLEEAGIRPAAQPEPPAAPGETLVPQPQAAPETNGTAPQTQTLVRELEPPGPPAEPPQPQTTEQVAGMSDQDFRAMFPNLTDEQFNAAFGQAAAETPPAAGAPQSPGWIGAVRTALMRLVGLPPPQPAPAPAPPPPVPGEPPSPAAPQPVPVPAQQAAAGAAVPPPAPPPTYGDLHAQAAAQKRAELEALLTDPRSNEEIQAEWDARNGIPPQPVGEGTPAAPIVAQNPSDIAAAGARAQAPTPAQAEAGNYRMGHVNVAGLPITVETPLGAERTGIAPDGTPWSVQMPADYGYIKRTEGADGDHVDVYLGPDAHQADKLPVYVVDQIDPATGNFDEHKALIGFPSEAIARSVYEAGFSDRSGPLRIGGITTMPFTQFKRWAQKGNTRKPLAYEPPAAPPITVAKQRAQYNRPLSLAEFLAASGGIKDQGGDLKAIGIHDRFVPKFGRLVRPNGRPLDYARELAAEAGYLPWDSSIPDLLNLLAEEDAGRPVYTPEVTADMRADRQTQQAEEEGERVAEARRALEEALKGSELKLTPEQKERSVQWMMQGYDTREAVTRMFIEEYEPLERQAEALDDAEYLDAVGRALDLDRKAAEAAQPGSGWDVPFEWEGGPNEGAGRPSTGAGNASAPAGGSATGSEHSVPAEPASSGNRPDERPNAAGDQGNAGAAGPGREPAAAVAQPGGAEQPNEQPGRDTGGRTEGASSTAEGSTGSRPNGSGAAAETGAAGLARAFAEAFVAGQKFATIQQARQFAGEKLGRAVQPGTMEAKQVDEAIELGAVMAGRHIVGAGGDASATFDRLLRLYDQQPKLGVRTSGSIERQAYSTPLPLAYAADRLAGIGPNTTVYEPTAGNGALLLTAGLGHAVANELDPARAAALKAQGFQFVFNGDATKADPAFAKTMQAVIANPPFGVVRGDDGQSVRFDMGDIQRGYTTGEIDHAIALRSLEAMQDDGTAVLILGGLNKLVRTPKGRADGYNGKAKREFYFTLYNKYRVVDHFTVPGELYSKQGAEWPVDVIVIRGRGKSDVPLPSVSAPRIVGSWEALKEVMLNGQPAESGRSNEAEGLAAPAAPAGVGRPVEPAGNGGAPDQGGAPAANDHKPVPPVAGVPGAVDAGEGGRPGRGDQGAGERAGEPGSVERPGQLPQPEAGGERSGAGEPRVPGPAGSGGEPAAQPVGGAPGASGGAGDQGHAAGGLAGSGVSEPSVGREVEKNVAAPPPDLEDQAPTKPRPKVETQKAQVAYDPVSKSGKPVGTLVPTNLSTATQQALDSVAAQHGSVDEFVADKLGYTAKQLEEYFSGEQIDAIALGIRQIDGGQGFIIGDQTGVGKGRVVAAMIRYAERKGLVPIFVTEKPNLYADMVRDLTDIGMPEIADQILATNAGLRLALTDDPDGPRLRTPEPKVHDREVEKVAQHVAASGKLPPEYRVVMTTYNQLQTVKGGKTARMRMAEALAPNSFLILDEAHNAGGAGAAQEEMVTKAGKLILPRSVFFRQLVGAAQSVFYSSATWAKRPDVMDLYGAKTGMREAVKNLSELADTIKYGGVPMQQIVTAQLAEVGQYIRRERSFDGVTYDLTPVPVDKKAYDEIAGILASIYEISAEHVKDAVDNISKEIRGSAGALSHDNSIGDAGATSTSFGAVMHNLINQMLLASKAQGTVDRALAKLKEGKKPVVTVANTMGSFIAEFAAMNDAKPGDLLDLTFNSLLNRYLQRTLRYVEKKPFTEGPGEEHWLKPSDLGPEGERLFRETEKRIKALKLGNMPVSPIDYIRSKLMEAGYKVGEITGRTEAADYRADGKVYYRQRPQKERTTQGRQETIRAFNRGDLDVMVLNQSGATGLSLHASKTFKDQRKRAMLIAQAEQNIDTHMQMLGRVHRTGQVIPPEYEQLVADIPAEKRPAAVLAAKMASLNASTTSSRRGAVQAGNVPDFINKYGGKVVERVLLDHDGLNRALGYPMGAEEAEIEPETLVRKVTGRIPLLPLAKQEEVYSDIERRYAAYIDELDKAGENGLEAKTLDLDAKLLQQKTFIEGKNEAGNPFTAPAAFDLYDIKRITKPPPPQRVVADLAHALGRKEEFTEESLADTSPQNLAKAIRSLATTGDGDRAERIAKLKDALKKAEAREFKDETAKERHLEKVQAEFQRLERIIETASPGRLIEIAAGPELLKTTALVIDLHIAQDKSALAPSNYTLTIVTDEGIRRSITGSMVWTPETQPQSDLPEDARIITPSNADEAAFLEGIAALGKGSREQRWIITGNILAAYSKQSGQIINFTDHAGELKQGILLKKDFDPAKKLAKMARTFTPKGAREFLESDAEFPYVTSSDKALRIARDNRGDLVVTAPAAKATGGDYYLDKGIQRVTGEFVKAGNDMRAKVPGHRLRDLLDAIQPVLSRKNQELVSDHPAAKKAQPQLRSGEAPEGWGTVEADRPISDEVREATLEAARRVVGPAGSVEATETPLGKANHPNGVGGFAVGQLARVSLAGQPERFVWNAHHEAVHVLRNLGLFSPGEWGTLLRAAEQQGWLDRFNIKQRYPTLSPEKQAEEAVAEMFAAISTNPAEAPKGVLPRAWAKTERFLTALRNALAGRGFNTPDSIFQRAQRGEIGQRPSPQLETRGPQSPAEARRDADYWEQALAQVTDSGEVDKLLRDDVAAALSRGVQFSLGDRLMQLPVVGGAATTLAQHWGDFDHTVKMMVSPMTAGSEEAMAIAKAFANSRRQVRWAGNRLIERLTKDFKSDQLRRMWEAADAESVALQSGNSPQGVGLDTLTPAERAEVESMQGMAATVFRQARAVGIHDSDPLPSYVPRMVVGIGVPDEAHVVRDIRTLALATMRLQEAIIGRKLIRQIKAVGRRSGIPTVQEGGVASIGRPMNPVTGVRTTTPQMRHRKHLLVEETEEAARQYRDADGYEWQTLPESAAFWTYQWAGNDDEGNPKFKRVPVYIRSDFWGPVRAVLHRPNGLLYRAAMELKGKMMSTIMYGVAHLGVIATRTLPVTPHLIAAMREGKLARDDVSIMRRAIGAGMVPIGRRGGYQDAATLERETRTKPGRSWTAQLLGAIPGFISSEAGDAVKRGVDKLGEWVHDKQLWERIGALQAGVFLRIEREELAAGQSAQAAAATAAHVANRIAGAIPDEAMSQNITKILNIVLFSRSYRAGNAGSIKDAFLGLPKDVQAFLKGSGASSEAVSRTVSRARRIAVAALILDMSLYYYVGSAALQSAIDVMRLGKTVAEEAQGYVNRFEKTMSDVAHGRTLNPVSILQSLTPMAEHEPGKQNRILIGFEDDGTAIYLRPITGKLGDDISGYLANQLQTLRQMMSPYMRAAWGGLVGRDPSFDRRIYDPYADTPVEVLEALGDYVGYVFNSSTPQTAIKAGEKLLTGQGGKFEAAQILGGAFGMSISHGYPGGPLRGEVHAIKEKHDAEVARELPQVRDKIKAGDLVGAAKQMQALGIRPQYQRFIVAQTKNPHATPSQIREVLRTATPEERELVLRYLRPATGRPPPTVGMAPPH